MSAATLLCALLAGCHAPRSYRRGEPFQAAATDPLVNAPVIVPGAKKVCTDAGPGCVDTLEGKPEPQNFYLSYIEFDDMGEFWSIGYERDDIAKTTPQHQSQLERALVTIHRAKMEAETKKTRLRVIGFVHGWQNNASTDDEVKPSYNLHDFKSAMQYIAKDCDKNDLDEHGQPRCPVVVGIFFGWRGRTIELEKPVAARTPSYAGRRDAANRVGGASMTEAVMRIANAVKGPSPAYDVTNRCQQMPDSSADAKRPQFIMIGHSFGGRVLERAVAQPMLALLLERAEQSRACVAKWNALSPSNPIQTPVVVPPLDLILMLNPANDALAAKEQIEAFKRAGLTDKGEHHPLIISVTSQGDTATGLYMKLGQKLAGGRPRERRYDETQGATACQQGQIQEKKQIYFYQHSPGNVKPMNSHNVKETDNVPKNDEEKCDAQDALASKTDEGSHFFFAPTDSQEKRGICFQIDTVNHIYGMYGVNSKKTQPYDRCDQSAYQNPELPQKQPMLAWNDTPYYVMSAPPTFIKDHDDIFNVGVYNFIKEFLTDNPRIDIAPSAPPLWIEEPASATPTEPATTPLK